MPPKLMKSVSGIRGVVGSSFTPELVVQVGGAFARFCKRGKIVIGRDGRPSGEAIASLLSSTLALCGCDVVDLGVVPTPTVQVMVTELSAAGGVVVSASHNPSEWNAFKLVDKTGSFLNESRIGKFFSMMDSRPVYSAWNRLGAIGRFDKADDVHIKMILGVVDAGMIARRIFRVALDSVNGAGSLITPKLLKSLGCSVIPVHCEATGLFPRGAEPLPENLKDLCNMVRAESADIGFAQDPDADRLAIVNERGEPIGEEYTISLVAEHLLSKKPGLVAVNLSTTKAVEEIARRHGSKCIRARVGEIHVVEAMRRTHARIGGEGNGGVISPEVHLGRDSLAGIAYVLEMMARRGKPVSALAEDLPRYVMKKGKVDAGSVNARRILRGIKARFRNERISEIDGLRIDFVKEGAFRGGWVHLRPSNTEPVFRIIAEGRDGKQAADIYAGFKKYFV